MRLILLVFFVATASAQPARPRIAWPEGGRAAVSLTFDDARTSQVDLGTALLDRHGAKATFYVVPDAVERRLEGWRAAVAAGHEIANHSLTHPCSGNFQWIDGNAIEDYTLDDMRRELTESNRRLDELLGVAPVSFAYPCGQKYVGRGARTESTVPLVAALFQTGRGWRDEAANDPLYADFAQLTGVEMDGMEFDAVLPLIEAAKAQNGWLVLAGHEIGAGGSQTTRVSMLEALLTYAADPANGVWLAPVAEVARFVEGRR